MEFFSLVSPFIRARKESFVAFMSPMNSEDDNSKLSIVKGDEAIHYLVLSIVPVDIISYIVLLDFQDER